MSNTMRIRDYYIVEVPGDCAESIDQLAQIAIDEARERAKLYCVPAEWSAKRVTGGVGDFIVKFRVRRIRNRVVKSDGRYNKNKSLS